ALTGSVPAGEWISYRYTVPADGRYLLRVLATAGTSGVYGLTRIWAADSIFSNYSGEFSASPLSPSTEEQPGLLTGGTYLVSVDNTRATATLAYSLALVSLEPPVTLTPGAAATAGTVDVPGERDYFGFAGTGGQSYTVRVNAGFAGELRVYKLPSNGDFTSR